MIYEEFYAEAKRLFALNGELVEMPSDEQIASLFDLTELMLEVNKSLNLTTITNCSQILLKHYIDSLTVSKYLPKGARIIDIGCGAGFPTLPLAIMRPDLDITALDATAKRIRYVESAAAQLGLSNVRAVAARAEEFVNAGNRESFDFALARAVAELATLSELCLGFVKVGGQFISMKGQRGEEELDGARRAIKLCGGEPSEVIRADLTENGEDFESRRLIITKKVETTPKIYPRAFAKISKKPL